MLICLAAIGFFRTEDWPTLTLLASPLLLEFLAGVWLGWLFGRGFRLPVWAASALGLAGFAALVALPLHSPQARALVWGVPALMIVQACLVLEEHFGRLIPWSILLAGDASYSIYLIHPLVFGFAIKPLERLGWMRPGEVSGASATVCVLFLLGTALLAGILLYRWIEKPVNESLRRRLKLRPVQVDAAHLRPAPDPSGM